MKIIQTGHDVVSLFDISSQTQALTRQKPNRQLVASLISAFLVVLVLGLTLSLAQKALDKSEATMTANEVIEIVDQEPVAFQPSRAVSQHIAAGTGYIGR